MKMYHVKDNPQLAMH